MDNPKMPHHQTILDGELVINKEKVIKISFTVDDDSGIMS
jgi:hypothetical protein